MLTEMIVDLPVMHAAQITNVSLTTEPLLNPGRIIAEKNMSGKAVTIGLSMGGKDGKNGMTTINVGARMIEIGETKVIGAVKSGNHAKVPTKAVVVARRGKGQSNWRQQLHRDDRKDAPDADQSWSKWVARNEPPSIDDGPRQATATATNSAAPATPPSQNPTMTQLRHLGRSNLQCPVRP